MFTPVIATIPLLVLPLLMSPTRDCQFGRMGDPAADERALIAFEVAVKNYVDLHRRLERAWPLSWFVMGLEPTEIAATELRAVLRDARPQAVRGGLFTPEVADVFRFRIATALQEQNSDVFSALPPLPPELEYRFIGRDLVLLDVHANLVVDTLDLALPASTSAADAEEPVAPFGEEPAGCWDEMDARE